MRGEIFLSYFRFQVASHHTLKFGTASWFCFENRVLYLQCEATVSADPFVKLRDTYKFSKTSWLGCFLIANDRFIPFCIEGLCVVVLECGSQVI